MFPATGLISIPAVVTRKYPDSEVRDFALAQQIGSTYSRYPYVTPLSVAERKNVYSVRVWTRDVRLAQTLVAYRLGQWTTRVAPVFVIFRTVENRTRTHSVEARVVAVQANTLNVAVKIINNQ